MRNLTDEDVQAIVQALKTSIRDEFYTDLGKGLWAYFKRGLFVIAVGIAAYGAFKGYK